MFLISNQLVATPIELKLDKNWQFKQNTTKKWYPAEVPGCVHTDLLSNHLIEDPFWRTNEKELQWVGEKDWEYFTVFDVSSEILEKDSIALVFHGLDTYADVILNGKKILAADNMHRTWRITCKSLLKEKDNKLNIYFHSVFKKAMPLLESSPVPLFQFPNNDQADTMVSMFVRKAGYQFGWDWGPRLVTAGVWRPIVIEAWDEARISGIHYVTQQIQENSADMIAKIEIESQYETASEIEIFSENILYVKKQINLKKGLNKIRVPFKVNNPKLWWANGLGEPHLYTFNCRLAIDHKEADCETTTTGVRTVEVVTHPDSFGKSLFVKLNGVPVFMKGANYIPNDIFAPRVSDSTYEYIIRSAAEANMNMLRLWGGGYFENDIFYNLCDKYGLLIWHDMLFACGTYPADDDYLKSVSHEVKDNVKRLSNHPSIALWSGNNEVEVAYYDWEWKGKLSPEQQVIQEENMQKLFYQTIPSAIFSVDSTRYYHPTCPNTGYNGIPFSEGDVHYWSVWHGKEPFETFDDQVGRFMSEYGFQSYPEPASVELFTLPEDRFLESEVMRSHQRCMADDRRDKGYGNRLIKHYMLQYYHEPKDFESYLYVSQLVQAKGVKMAIESHRRHMPFCMGTLYWQINDCWPVASWSSIDSYGKWKALHYVVQDIYKEQLLSVIAKDDEVKVYAVSDRLAPVEAALDLRLTNLHGDILWKKESPVKILANSSEIVFNIDKTELLGKHPKQDVIFRVALNEKGEILASNSFLFVPEKELSLQAPKIKMKYKKNDNKTVICLQSDVLAKGVFLSISGDNGFFTDNFFDLFPGETKTVQYSGKLSVKDLKKHLQVISLVDSYE